jgi:hypothetical protein
MGTGTAVFLHRGWCGLAVWRRDGSVSPDVPGRRDDGL